MPRRIDPIDDDTDYFIQANTSAEDVVALHQPKSLLTRRSFRRQSTSATAELSTCTYDNNEEEIIVVQVAPLDDKPLSSPEQTLEQHNNKSQARCKGQRRPGVTRRHSMSDIAAPSRWSLALERYQKQKEVPTKEGPSSSSPVRRRCTENDISDLSDFDGLTPKLYSEVERLSTSCHTLLTSCSTESPAHRRGSKTSTDETASTAVVDGGGGDRKPRRRSKPILSNSIRSKSSASRKKTSRSPYDSIPRSKSATSLSKAAATSSSTRLKKKVCPTGATTTTEEVAQRYYKPSSSSSSSKKKSSLDEKIEKKKKELLELEKQKSMKSLLPNINLDTTTKSNNSKKKKRQRPVMVRSVSVNHALRLSQRDDESVSSLELSLRSSTSSLEVGELFDLLMSIED